MQRIIAIQVIAEIITQYVAHHEKAKENLMPESIMDIVTGIIDRRVAKKLHDAIDALACVHEARVSWPGPQFIVTDPLGKEVLLNDFKDVLAMEYGYKSYVEMLGKEGDPVKQAQEACIKENIEKTRDELRKNN